MRAIPRGWLIAQRLANPHEKQGQSEAGHGRPIHVRCMVGLGLHRMLKMTIQITPPLEREQSSTSFKKRMFILKERIQAREHNKRNILPQPVSAGLIHLQ